MPLESKVYEPRARVEWFGSHSFLFFSFFFGSSFQSLSPLLAGCSSSTSRLPPPSDAKPCMARTRRNQLSHGSNSDTYSNYLIISCISHLSWWRWILISLKKKPWNIYSLDTIIPVDWRTNQQIACSWKSTTLDRPPRVSSRYVLRYLCVTVFHVMNLIDFNDVNQVTSVEFIPRCRLAGSYTAI